MLQAGTLAVALKMLLIWLLVLAAGATAAGLVANAAQRSGLSPWRRP
jgi:multicomponent Na+:H+ antiporter subunit G